MKRIQFCSLKSGRRRKGNEEEVDVLDCVCFPDTIIMVTSAPCWLDLQHQSHPSAVFFHGCDQRKPSKPVQGASAKGLLIVFLQKALKVKIHR